jgi:hypothetical protein
VEVGETIGCFPDAAGEVKSRKRLGRSDNDPEDSARLECSRELWLDPRPALLAIARPAIEMPTDDGGKRLSPWALRWERTPAMRRDEKGDLKGTQVHSRDMMAIAREYFRVHGADGKSLFAFALERKRAVSPDLKNPSAKNGDLRNPFDFARFGQRAWNKAAAEPFSEMPISEISALARNPNPIIRGAARVYAMLFLECIRLGVRPANFAKDSRSIAKYLGVGQTTARRWRDAAEDLGILIILDRGKPRALEGVRSAPARYQLRTAAAEAALLRIRDRTAV